MNKEHEISDQFNLPDDFDFDQEVINFQFAMMLKFRSGYEKRLNMEEMKLKSYLKEHFTDNKYVDKIMKRVQLQAYYTIPGEFWKTLKK